MSDSNRCLSDAFGFKRTDFKGTDEIEDCSEIAVEMEPSDAAEEDLESTIVELEQLAYQKGFCAGQKEGAETARQEMEPVIKSFQQAVEQFQLMRKEVCRSIEREAVELALAIANKIVCHEVKINRDVIISVIRRALVGVEASGDVIVKLNPADLQRIQKSEHSISKLLPDFEHTTFEAHESILRGGCMIETHLGDIDARIEQQLQIVEESLHSEFSKSAIEG